MTKPIQTFGMSSPRTDLTSSPGVQYHVIDTPALLVVGFACTGTSAPLMRDLETQDLPRGAEVPSSRADRPPRKAGHLPPFLARLGAAAEPRFEGPGPLRAALFSICSSTFFFVHISSSWAAPGLVVSGT